MSSDNIVIKVENLSKCYHIYDQPQDRLKQSLIPRLQGFLGRTPRQYFHEFWALRDVSLEINKGETVGVIGRNGSGKSTLLQLICGTLNPTGGTVSTNGRIAALLELGSGFNPEFTGRENVYFYAAILGLANQEVDRRFNDIADFADIGQFIEQPVKTYSSGMLVRLAFAVAINIDPQILIVDEALSVGDELFQRKCFSRIAEIKKGGATILFVSHSGSTVVELCDRAVLLDSGEKLAMGTPKYIVGKYQKLIYASKEKVTDIRDEIRLSDNHQKSSMREASNALNITDQVTGEKKQLFEKEIEELYDPNLKPQSTLVYESQGAYIESPEITTLTGQKVNYVRRGAIYRYSYVVKFDKQAMNVRFGMLIKTTTGLELGGAVSASTIGQGIPYLASGTVVKVNFNFLCSLNPGLYYLNAGVTGIIQRDDVFLHRITDACMFKVMPLTENKATAIIDFNCMAEIEIENNSLYQEKVN